MNQHEFFPPTEKELEEIIAKMKAKLEDERYSDEWKKLLPEYEQKVKELEELKRQR